MWRPESDVLLLSSIALMFFVFLPSNVVRQQRASKEPFLVPVRKYPALNRTKLICNLTGEVLSVQKGLRSLVRSVSH